MALFFAPKDFRLTPSPENVPLLAVYTRSFQTPGKRFFLFGPRGTGKSTWVRVHFPKAYVFHLLTVGFSHTAASPLPFESGNRYIAPRSGVMIDEIQKLPILLDEVHSFLEEQPIPFVLTRFSARAFKKSWDPSPRRPSSHPSLSSLRPSENWNPTLIEKLSSGVELQAPHFCILSFPLIGTR